MINNLHKTSKWLVVFAALMLIFNTLYFISVRGEVIKSSCFSVLRTSDESKHFRSALSLTLVMNPNMRGYISFSGDISLEEKKMVLSREINFSYKKDSDGIYKLYDFKTSKRLRDTAPDTIVDHFLFSSTHEKARLMTLSKIQNTFLIGNLHSPVFMCIKK